MATTARKSHTVRRRTPRLAIPTMESYMSPLTIVVADTTILRRAIRRPLHPKSSLRKLSLYRYVALNVLSQPIYALQSSHSGHRSRRHHHSSSHHHHSSHRLTLGERIARFFGFGNSSRHYKYRSRNESWGFLGHGRRRRYRDAYTGQEVDRKGRPVIRV